VHTCCDLSTRATWSFIRRTDSEAGNIPAHFQVYGAIRKMLHVGIFVELVNVSVKWLVVGRMICLWFLLDMMGVFTLPSHLLQPLDLPYFLSTGDWSHFLGIRWLEHKVYHVFQSDVMCLRMHSALSPDVMCTFIPDI